MAIGHGENRLKKRKSGAEQNAVKVSLVCKECRKRMWIDKKCKETKANVDVKDPGEN